MPTLKNPPPSLFNSYLIIEDPPSLVGADQFILAPEDVILLAKTLVGADGVVATTPDCPLAVVVILLYPDTDFCTVIVEN